MSTRLRWTAALVSGLALAFAFPPFNLGSLAWISLSLLLAAAIGADPGRAALFGLAHGLAFYCVSVPWIFTVMRVHGGLEAAPAAGVFALLVVALSVCPAIFAAGVALCARRSLAHACLAAPFLWVATEFLRRYELGIGFPWNLLGYAAALHLGLLQLATVTGVYGLSFVLMAFNALLALVFLTRTRPAWRGGVIVAVVIVSALLAGDQFVPREEPQTQAELVQTNFPQATSYPPDWIDRHAGDLNELENLSLEASARAHGVIIWPESPAPFYWQDPRFAARLSRLALTSGNSVLAGVVDWKRGPGNALLPYNTAVLVDPAGHRVFSYDKVKLVPFGEYVPWRRWLSFAEGMMAEIGDFQPGTTFPVGMLPGGRYSVFICYEAVFPDLIRRFTRNGAGLLINLSNDGWFGHSAAAAQHLAQARVRAVENRRWLLRATNTGITASIDPYGRIVASLPIDRRTVLIAPFAFRNDVTLYNLWGDWFCWVCLLFSVVFLALGAMPREEEQEEEEQDPHAEQGKET